VSSFSIVKEDVLFTRAWKAFLDQTAQENVLEGHLPGLVRFHHGDSSLAAAFRLEDAVPKRDSEVAHELINIDFDWLSGCSSELHADLPQLVEALAELLEGSHIGRACTWRQRVY
jgi:hypothetical protein